MWNLLCDAIERERPSIKVVLRDNQRPLVFHGDIVREALPSEQHQEMQATLRAYVAPYAALYNLCARFECYEMGKDGLRWIITFNQKPAENLIEELNNLFTTIYAPSQ